MTRAWVGARLSRILSYEYGAEYDPARRYPGRLYFVPSETLVEETAQALGIRDEHDLFGGVTPHAFLCSKAIAHPVIQGGSTPPDYRTATPSRNNTQRPFVLPRQTLAFLHALKQD